jgi:RPA family protein
MDKPIREVAYKTWISDISSAEFKNGGLAVGEKIVSRVNLIGSVVGRYDKDESYSSLTIDDGSAGIRVKAWNEGAAILEDIEPGDILLVIGKIRQSSNGEIFVSPEIAKRVGVEWEMTRKLELLKEYGRARKQEVETVHPAGSFGIERAGEKRVERAGEVFGGSWKNSFSVGYEGRNERIGTRNYVEEHSKNIASEDIASEVEVIKIGSVRQMILDCIKLQDRTFDEIRREIGYPEEEVDSALQELINEGEIYEVKGVYRLLG